MCNFNSSDIRKEKFKSNLYALLIGYKSPDFFKYKDIAENKKEN